ncbi:MAG: hypothetical protein ACO3RU_15355, partial [Planctomycetota bacterium]
MFPAPRDELGDPLLGLDPPVLGARQQRTERDGGPARLTGAEDFLDRVEDFRRVELPQPSAVDELPHMEPAVEQRHERQVREVADGGLAVGGFEDVAECSACVVRDLVGLAGRDDDLVEAPDGVHDPGPLVAPSGPLEEDAVH